MMIDIDGTARRIKSLHNQRCNLRRKVDETWRPSIDGLRDAFHIMDDLCSDLVSLAERLHKELSEIDAERGRAYDRNLQEE